MGTLYNVNALLGLGNIKMMDIDIIHCCDLSDRNQVMLYEGQVRCKITEPSA